MFRTLGLFTAKMQFTVNIYKIYKSLNIKRWRNYYYNTTIK